MENILKNIFLTGLFFLFFKMFVLFIVPGTGAVIPVFLLFIAPLYIYCISYNFRKFLNYIVAMYKFPYMKYYLMFMIFVFLTTITHMILGYYYPPIGRYIIHMKDFFIVTILVLFMPALGSFLKVKMKSMLKVLYIIIYLVPLIAVIQYLSFVFNVSIINIIIGFFTNFRACVYNSDTGQEAMRVFSIFGEPSSVGRFMFITLPFIINMSTMKEKIFSNPRLDKFIKYTIMPLALLTIIFTKSPIYLIFCFGELLILETIKYKNVIKKHILTALPVLTITTIILLAVMVIASTSMSDSYLGRITTVTANFGSMDGLVTEEASLATRIIAYYWQIIAFTHNIFFGCGLNNVETFLNTINVHVIANTPMTLENMKMVFMEQEIIGVNRSLVWSSLAEFGLVGTVLYFIFFFKNLFIVNKLKKIVSSELNYCTLHSIFQSLIMIYIIGFYNLSMTNENTIWLFYGLILVYLYLLKYKPGERL